MATSYPTALDTFSNPASGDALNSAAVPHATQHANANDAIEAIEALLGANGANYVSVAAAQTISGAKTFSANVILTSTTRLTGAETPGDRAIGFPHTAALGSTVFWGHTAGQQPMWSFRGQDDTAYLTIDNSLGVDTTHLLLRTNHGGIIALRRVVVGAADSAGAGFRTLRIAN